MIRPWACYASRKRKLVALTFLFFGQIWTKPISKETDETGEFYGGLQWNPHGGKPLYNFKPQPYKKSENQFFFRPGN